MSFFFVVDVSLDMPVINSCSCDMGFYVAREAEYLLTAMYVLLRSCALRDCQASIAMLNPISHYYPSSNYFVHHIS